MTSVGRNEQPSVKAARSAPVLPWMRLPVSVTPGDSTPLEAVGGLHPGLKTTLLERLSIDSLFPVQSTVWRLTAGGMSGVHDVCLSAPTGSGKTLAYALPIVNALATSTRKKIPQIHRPQALFLLPTRDLALQVYSVLEPLCDATGLTCSTVCGTVSPPREAQRVVECDLLVATPGRLMTHVNGTPGFSLSFLKFIVIDEADRLLRQSYHEWVKILHPQSLANAKIVKVVKFVVSATLTKDPSKLDRLGLHCPRFVAMVDPNDYRYKLPPRLDQTRWVVPETKKPHALVTLLAAILQKYTSTTTLSRTLMIFASSLTTTHRLAVLLRAVVEEGGLDLEVREYSGAVPPAERAKALGNRLDNQQYQQYQQWTVIVCSDAMSRGMDVDVSIVINYDAPVYAKTYVHRAGRTARAGRAGKVITLLARQEVRHFKQMMCKAEGQDGEGRSSIKEDTTASVLSAEAVQRLEQAVNSALPRVFVQDDSVVNLNKGIHDAGTKGAKLGKRKKKRLRVKGVPEINLLTA